MRRVAREVRRYTRLRVPVLLQGESGTGKDLVARALHSMSGRPGAYVPLNAGAMPESLADAELFGHFRGAFTGAVATRPGAFQEADHGTLFLDEIAELAPSVQVKLLRVVEDGNTRPVGASRTLSVDVRIVAATWMPLARRAAEGRFRADLYHRLALAVIELPPLRQRRSDIPALSSAILEKLEPELGPKRLSSAALARLVAHHWPGNVRELGGALYRAAVVSPRVLIDAEHVELGTIERQAQPRPSPEQAKKLVLDHRGNVSAAARAAGVARSTFRAWLERTDV
jgi:DNA-binding NtrC family response regulator